MDYFWNYAFLQRGLAMAILGGGVCGAMGVFVVLWRMSLVGMSISHAAFAGALLSLISCQNHAAHKEAVAPFEAIEQFTAGSENQLHVQLGSLVIGCDALLKQGCLLAVNRSCRVFSSGAAFLYGRKIICIRHDSTSCFYYTT